MPFGYGEVEPIDKRFSISVARFSFLNSIKGEAPEVLKDLADLPFRTFCDANVNPHHLWPISDTKETLYELHGRSIVGFRLALLRWARRWHLEADWLLNEVC